MVSMRCAIDGKRVGDKCGLPAIATGHFSVISNCDGAFDRSSDTSIGRIKDGYIYPMKKTFIEYPKNP